MPPVATKNPKGDKAPKADKPIIITPAPAAEDTSAMEGEGQKRGRGRPKGSKNADKPLAKKTGAQLREERKIIHPDHEAIIWDGFPDLPGHDDLMGVETMKELLDWQEEGDGGGEGRAEGEKFGKDFLFIDHTGNKVRLGNNVGNRPFDYKLAETWATEILKKHWQFNGESFIIGRTGITISGQHRGVGLVLAHQMWSYEGKDKDKLDAAKHWKKIWGDEEPSMPLLVVYGVDESDAVVNTIDTGKPRSPADAIYRSEIFPPSKFSPAQRRILSRNLEYAVRLLWKRTGAKVDAFTPRRTHTDTFEFIERHKRLIRCVNHIYTEDGDAGEHKCSKWVGSAGSTAGLMYLMAASADDGEAYRKPDPENRGEGKGKKALQFSEWDRACEFWVLLAGEESSFNDVRRLLSDMGEEASPKERIAVICKAWNLFREGHKLRYDLMKLRYTPGEDGIDVLDDFPEVGGIDLGPKAGESETQDDVPTEENPEPLERKKAEIKAKNLEGMKEENKMAAREAKKTGKGKGEKKTPAPEANGEAEEVVTEEPASDADVGEAEEAAE